MAAMARFSRTGRSRKIFTDWNVRPTPRRAISWVASPSMRSPS